MIDVKKIVFSDYADEYGHLSPVEENKDIPFRIKRVYYITKVGQGVRRGFHSHKKLEQVLICVNGSVKILVKTPYEEQEFLLDDATEGLYIGSMIWREMFDFSNQAVLLVLASEPYDVHDYIRDYSTYELEAREYYKKRFFYEREDKV